MSKYLVIAGHGRKRNGVFDPGASGFIGMGEYNYMKNKLFPTMKKYSDNNFIYYTESNVYSYGNIVALAREYGKNTKVIECHFDASSNQSAKGGHVIVYSGYKPDDMDLRLRNVINKHLGVRYTHRGYKGISGRSNLANVNRTAKGNVNFRLLELGFGTNRDNADTLLYNTDVLAKDLVQAIQGKPITVKPPVSTPVNNISQLVNEVLQGKHGNGEQRRKSLGSNYTKVQNEINKRFNIKPVIKSTRQLANEVLQGKHGNGEQRKQSLGSRFNEVQMEVNRLLR